MSRTMDTTNTNTSRNGKTAGTSKIVRYVVAAVGAVLIAFCGWSMSEYVQGRDPFAFALGSDALQTTVEAKDEAQAKKDEKAEAQSQKSGDDKASNGKSSKKSSEKNGAKTSAKKNDASSKQNAASKSNDDAANEDAGQRESDSAGEAVTQEVVYYEDEADAPAQQGSQQEATQPAQEEQSEASQVITISLSVDGGAGSSSATLELQPGSTALDALYAAGVGIDSIPNPFGAGTWVTSIGGLAEEAGHGWTYRVNGDLPGVMSDLYVLSDGDYLLWQYV